MPVLQLQTAGCVIRLSAVVDLEDEEVAVGRTARREDVQDLRRFVIETGFADDQFPVFIDTINGGVSTPVRSPPVIIMTAIAAQPILRLMLPSPVLNQCQRRLIRPTGCELLSGDGRQGRQSRG